jgi:hypothetical protein
MVRVPSNPPINGQIQGLPYPPFTRNQGNRGFSPDLVRCIRTIICGSSLSRDSVRDPDVMLQHLGTCGPLLLSRAFASGGSTPA